MNRSACTLQPSLHGLFSITNLKVSDLLTDSQNDHVHNTSGTNKPTCLMRQAHQENERLRAIMALEQRRRQNALDALMNQHI